MQVILLNLYYYNVNFSLSRLTVFTFYIIISHENVNFALTYVQINIGINIIVGMMRPADKEVTG